MFFATSIDLLAVVGFDGEIQRVSASWASLLGYTEAELLQTSYHTLLHHDDTPAISEALRQLSETGEDTESFELRLRCKDGTYRWALGSAHPDPERRSIYISAKDIDERRQVEEALREAEERFRLAFEHASVGMAITGLDGVFERANAAMCKMMGYSEKALIGSHVDMLELESDPLLLTAPSLQLLNGELDVYRGEFPMRRSDGGAMWVQLSISLAHDAQGEPRAFLAQCIDVTERRQAEAALRFRSEMEAVLASVSARLISIEAGALHRELRDGLGRIAELLDVDRAYLMRYRGSPDDCEIIEWCSPEAPPRSAPGEPSPEVAAWWGKVLLDGNVVYAPRVAELTGDGAAAGRRMHEQGVVSLLIVPTQVRRHSACFIGLVTVSEERAFSDDVVGLLRLAGESFMNTFDRADADAALNDAANLLEHRNEELERSNEELERFAFFAAHDLTAPLSRVEMAVHALDRAAEQLEPDHRELLAIASRGSARMRRLIEDLLGYATVGKGLGPPEPIDLQEVVTQVIADLSDQITAAGASVEVAGVLATVTGQRSLLGQLFQNLIANALKFAKPGVPPVVRLTAEVWAHGQLISVSDNGIGIDPEHRSEVFGMFTRLNGDDAHPGSGIGLATCAKVAHLYGGRIWVDEGIDGGSRFRVSLPG